MNLKNLKNRLVKLERITIPGMPPLVLIQSDDGWTKDQLHQMKEAEAEGRMIVKVFFV